jgi:hypothetical protein
MLFNTFIYTNNDVANNYLRNFGIFYIRWARVCKHAASKKSSALRTCCINNH